MIILGLDPGLATMGFARLKRLRTAIRLDIITKLI